MPIKPLRHVLTLQSLLSIVLPFGVVVLCGFFWLLPQIRTDAGERQIQLAHAIGMQVESHFETGTTIVKGAAAIEPGRHPGQYGFQEHFDALLGSNDTISCLYSVATDGKVSFIALRDADKRRTDDLTHLNLSNSPLFRSVSKNNKPFWSETFLSIVNGGLSVAYGLYHNGTTTIGEIDLAHLSRFLKQISTEQDLLIFIVDHKGQVVADNHGRYTAQQLNIGNLSLVQNGIRTDAPTTDRFVFDGIAMTGSIIQIPDIDWHVIVAKSDAALYRTSRYIAWVVIAGILIAIFSSTLTSTLFARKLAVRFSDLTGYAQDIAQGRQSGEWPVSSIEEFNQLSGTLQLMASRLLDSEVLYRTLFEQLPEGVVMWSIPDLRLLQFNTAAHTLLGYTREEFSVLTVADFEESRGNKDFDDMLATLHQKGIISFESIHRTKSGDSRSMFIILQLIDLKDQQMVLAIHHDITEREIREAERQKFEQQLHQVQRIESVGKLAGGVAHDFNNKLTVILGCTYLAHAESNPAQLKTLLDEIKKAAEQSADLTRQLLAFARRQTIAPRVLDLNETVLGMLKMLKRLMGVEINLVWQPAADLWPVKVDPSQIDQILANLCVNARDSVSGIGKITIETKNSIIDQNYSAQHVDAIPGEYVSLSVSDNGCGMDKETLAHIFEPFFTTKGVGEGTGLGLATVFGAVKQNDGFINVYSEPGRGTTFTIYLPRYAGSVAHAQSEISALAAPRGLETILLVEDERAILNMITTILTNQGYTVLPAHTPADALRLVTEHAGAIKLLITDVIMPEMNGMDLAVRLKSLSPQLKCLFMSGYTADAIARHGVLDDGVNFIQKPFTLPAIATKVRAVLDSQQ